MSVFAPALIRADRPITSALTSAITAALGGFNPRSLFSAGEQGAWYDLSDSTTLFTDSAGTTAAVVNGPVGLVLDKSKAKIVARRNLATNSNALQNYTALLSPIVTANAAVAPDGTTTATQVEVAAGQTAFSLRNAGPGTIIGNNANSIYFKLVGATTGQLAVMRADRANEYCGVNVDTLAPLTTSGNGISNSSVSIETLPNGWYRLKGAYTSDTASETRISLTGSVAGAKILLWGVQVELNTLTVTDYQQVVTGFGDWMAGNHAYQTTATSRPTLRGTPTGLDGDGTDDALLCASAGGGTTGFLFQAAIRPDVVSKRQTIWSDAGTNTGYKVELNASNQLVFSAGNGTAYTSVTTANTVAAGTTYSVECYDDGTNLVAILNQGTPATAARPAVSAGTASFTMQKDNGAASGFMDGVLYSAIYLKNTAKNSTTRAASMRWIRQKAGL